MLPAFPGHFTLAGDPQVDLVDQGRRRQRLARRLSCQSHPSELVQLGINQRKEVGRRLTVPGLSHPENRRHRGDAWGAHN